MKKHVPLANRWEDPPHHEFRDDEKYGVPRDPFNTFGYIPVIHKNCGGSMRLVKLYVDCFPEDERSKDFRRPDSLGVSRVVLGLKCEKCGYVNCLKLTLLDTRIFTREDVKPRVRREKGRGKYPAISKHACRYSCAEIES